MDLNGKGVLLTGASGFIGSNLAKKLVQLGAHVTVIDNISYGSKSNIPARCTVVPGDVKDPAVFEKLNDSYEYVFHLGAPSSIILFNKDPLGCFNDTVNGLINVMRFARAKKVKKVIFPSSGSVYGEVAPPQSESISPKPVNLYGVAKLSCEYVAKTYKDVDWVALRIFAGYGPGEEHKNEFASPVTLFLTAIIKDESPVIFGDGTQSRDFVYIDDVVNAFISAAENTHARGVINVGSGKSHTFNDVVNTINKLLGKKIAPKYIEKPINYLENTQADIHKSKEMLSLQYISLEEGLSRYLKHIQQQ